MEASSWSGAQASPCSPRPGHVAKRVALTAPHPQHSRNPSPHSLPQGGGVAQVPPCCRIWGFKRVRAFRAQFSLDWYLPTWTWGSREILTPKINRETSHWPNRSAGLEGISEALNAWCRNPLPSLILFLGVFGTLGTAFEELGRGACLPFHFFSLSFLILLFLFPIPGPQ